MPDDKQLMILVSFTQSSTLGALDSHLACQFYQIVTKRL